MTTKIKTNRELSGRMSHLAARMKEHYKLDETPQLAFDETAGVIEVPDLPDIEAFIESADVTPVGQEWKHRARELLDKDKLTQKEDDELKLLHRKLFRELLAGGLD